MKLLFAVPLLLVSLLAAAGAAAPPPASAATSPMQPLAFLVGRWRGSGYVEFVPGQRHTFQETERIEPELNGMLLLIEGRGTSSAGPGRRMVTHDALAVVSYDPAAGDFHWQAYNAAGPHLEYVDTHATVKDGVVRWGYSAGPMGQVRFTFRLDRQGRWVERGEMSHDGKTWRRFFAMTLHRMG
ncbi:MAG: hypothetical protein ACRD2F_14725 [Terriglobales bacterium]